jgi:outer membrane protein insertion porin family
MREFPGSLRRPTPSIFLAFLCALLGAAAARGQGGPPIIRSIDVQYAGPATVSKERILAQMRTSVGQPYSETVVEQDIQNLYKTGSILNVRIFAQPEGDGVKVIVAVQTRSVVREIEISGAERINPRRIRKEIGIKVNSMVNEQTLETNREKIVDIYKARGYNDVDVTFRVEPIDEKRGTARVVFTINEGVKGAIRSVHFEGNAHFSERVLRKQMKTRGKTLLSFVDKSGRLDETQLQQDLDSIKEFYQNHGYVDVEVRGVRKERADGRVILTIAINEGIQYHVGKLTVSGYQATTEAKIRALLKMKEGSVYSPKALNEDAKAIVDGYGMGGYADTLVLPEGSPSGAGRIDLHYKIEEGDRFFLQRITIVGNTRTKDKVIRREVLIVPGDVFNTVRIETTKKRLENLGYFSKVETFPEDTGVAGRKDLLVQVEEKRTGSLTFGGGFSTVDQLVGFAELTQGNFDLFNWPSFTGGGQKFRLRVQYGTERKDFILALTEPWFLDRPFSLSGQAFYSEADYLSSLYNQRDYGFSIEARKPINVFLYASLGYRLEVLDIFNIASGISEQLAQLLGQQTKSQIYSTVVFDRRDNPLLSRTGQRVTVSPYIAGGFLGGNDQIYGWDLQGSQYFHMWWDTILLLNAEAATVDNWGGGKTVQIYDRLFLGGSDNLRGFEYRDVSPKDFNKEPLGGQSMARATIEWTFPIIVKARGAIFYDTGFVNTDAWDFSLHTQAIPPKPRPVGSKLPPREPIFYDNLASDIGIGLRLDLPIGPLRLDYGIPIQKAGNTNHGKFNFNVGYQF